MSKHKQQIKYFLFSLISFLPALAVGADLRPEVPKADAVEAARNYWESFDNFEHKRVQDGREKVEVAFSKLRTAYERQQAQLNDMQIETLKKAIAKYTEHVKEHPESENVSYAMLNMAQLLNKLADHYAASSATTSYNYRHQALEILEQIQKNDPAFALKEEVLYAVGLTYENLGTRERSLEAWNKLAHTAKNSQYGLFALIALGDYYFDTEEAKASLNYYKLALDLVGKIKVEDPGYENLRIRYRLVWAGFRAGDLDTSISAGIGLLTMAPASQTRQQEDAIRLDAVEVVGDAMYEKNSLEEVKKNLSKKELASFAPKIGMRVMQNYLARENHTDVAELGEFMRSSFPTCRELPDVLTMMVSSYRATTNSPKFLEVAESLALLMPDSSLWRKRHAEDLAAIRAMEQKATAATKALAGYHYEYGMKTGNINGFRAAVTFYQMLLDKFPNDDEHPSWRLKIAHSHYFAEEYEAAAVIYESLKTKYRLSLRDLKVASYQLALTQEKLWRKAFFTVSASGRDAVADSKVLGDLVNLEKAVEEYANRFPFDRSADGENSYDRVVDLLLMAASALRDHEQLDKAAGYWQRALISHPTPAQRAIAIRGMVLSALVTNNPEEVIKVTGKFLRLEDWRALGSSLDNELSGIMAAAAKEHGNQLRDQGKALEAGRLLVGIAEQYTYIPDRDQIYRDGGYLLAIGGDWAAAEAAAAKYLADGLKKNGDDMLYLQARCQEYQMKFGESAVTYLRMGSSYPKHPKAFMALSSAERLAAAEEDWVTAAKAAELITKHSKDVAVRQRYYKKAIDYASKNGDTNSAITYANALTTAAPDHENKLAARLMAAKLTYQRGEETEAIKEYQAISSEVVKREPTMEKAAFSALYGEANFLLAEEERTKFDSFRIKEREGTIAENVRTKLSYMGKLTRHYEKAAKSGSESWVPQSYYAMGAAAESLADEMAALPYDTKLSLSPAGADRLKEQADRLRKLAQSYYGKNLLLKTRNPVEYSSNVWVKKSALKMFGKKDDSENTGSIALIPDELGRNLLSRWSM